MLGAIAMLPLFASHFWEKNQNKLIVALVLSIPTSIYLVINGMGIELWHSIINDYIPFLVLLGSLFIITGGIHVSGDINSKPLVNSTFLLIGAVLASFMGTTGAAMLLIRPLLESNKERKFKVHTILFFIAIAANCGGLLTPLGDPPLFMMYLRGANFFWFSNLFKEWAFTNLLLIIIYFIVDNYYWKKETPEAKYMDLTNITPIKIKGKLNFIWLIGVVLGVAIINENVFNFIKQNQNMKYLRELFLIIMAVLSIITTKKYVRKANKFSWEPIEEVAYLFLGIFITMVPALEYLKANASTLGITLPYQFYYATGALSSFLDNTPTAVTFYYLQIGLVESMPHLIGAGVNMIAGIPENIMTSICLGAVFFGSMTYIGNGPNFMVKAIAESQGVKMPDFFAYMYKFSLIVLLPIFILVQLLFVH
jgi:Na+/H+ antiporter NhaD/arsenite permease-like protein